MDANINSITALVEAVASSNAAALVMVVALMLAVATLILAQKAAESTPDKVSRRDKGTFIGCLVTTLLLTAYGPAVGFVEAHHRLVSHEAADGNTVLEDLKTNRKVVWVIRLIPYMPGSTADLDISRLQTLGPSNQEYTFVADYDELKGDNVSDAVRRVGGRVLSGQHVSAIIFPLTMQLFPANARGLLQVVQLLDARALAKSPGYQRVSELDSLGSSALRDLSVRSIPSYAWESYGPRFYQEYCELAQQLRCSSGQYSAMQSIAGLNDDWDPLGFSFRKSPADVCASQERERQCSIGHWRETQRYAEDIGVRAFFVANVALSTLQDRIMIDFAEPSQEMLPVLPEDPSQ